MYLGLHSTEPEAARVYDRALVLLAGPAAATNFPTSNYAAEMDLFLKYSPLIPRCTSPAWADSVTRLSILLNMSSNITGLMQEALCLWKGPPAATFHVICQLRERKTHSGQVV